MAPEAEALIGSVLEGAYRIDRLLGEGGMGAVYAATQLRLDKPVAVKVMARDLARNAEAMERFRREARITSALGHPHIVQVFDFSTTETGEPFIAMEFLDGEDLEHRIRRKGQLDAREILHIVRQVAAALMAAHGKGIVHRDLKPANIYLLHAAGEDDFVKVLDFGISKITTSSTQLTRPMAVVGTPNYMSPEQAEGKNEDIDERTDQWALAVITWECLTGELLFVGDSPMAILLQIVNKPPQPLLPKAPDLPPQVENVLMRALARDKRDRYASVSDFASALEAALCGNAGAVPPATKRIGKAPTTALDTPNQHALRPSTTFTQSTGSLSGKSSAVGRPSKAWTLALAAGTVVLMLLGVLWFLRPAPVHEPAAAGPPPAEPAPKAVEPPPLLAPAPPAVEVPPTALIPAATPEPKPKKSKRSVPSISKGTPTTPAAAPVRPRPKTSKESQDRWRLD